jgi:hypothetical protein
MIRVQMDGLRPSGKPAGQFPWRQLNGFGLAPPHQRRLQWRLGVSYGRPARGVSARQGGLRESFNDVVGDDLPNRESRSKNWGAVDPSRTF